jgi:hypothetical protein
MPTSFVSSTQPNVNNWMELYVFEDTPKGRRLEYYGLAGTAIMLLSGLYCLKPWTGWRDSYSTQGPSTNLTTDFPQ